MKCITFKLFFLSRKSGVLIMIFIPCLIKIYMSIFTVEGYEGQPASNDQNDEAQTPCFRTWRESLHYTGLLHHKEHICQVVSQGRGRNHESGRI